MTPPADRATARRRRTAVGKLAELRRAEEDAAARAHARAVQEEEVARERGRRSRERLAELRRARAEHRTRRFTEATGARADRAARADAEDRAARAALAHAESAVRDAQGALDAATRRTEQLRRALAESMAARRAAELVGERLDAEEERWKESAAELEQEDVAAARVRSGSRTKTGR